MLSMRMHLFVNNINLQDYLNEDSPIHKVHLMAKASNSKGFFIKPCKFRLPQKLTKTLSSHKPCLTSHLKQKSTCQYLTCSHARYNATQNPFLQMYTNITLSS